MAYTVKQLAELTGTSVRALHHYDELGLLKPAFVGENGYRYYEDAQLRQLNVILHYRDLGLSLSDVQRLLAASPSERVELLNAHHESLVAAAARTKEMMAMTKQAEYEQYLIDRFGPETERRIEDGKKRPPVPVDEGLHEAFVAELKGGRSPDDPAVQSLVAQHYRWVCHYWTPDRESYTGLAQLYLDHPDFRKFYDKFDAGLVDFLAAAMKAYAAKSLQ